MRVVSGSQSRSKSLLLRSAQRSSVVCWLVIAEAAVAGCSIGGRSRGGSSSPAAATGVGASNGAPATMDTPLDRDTDYPGKTPRLYLTGKGSDDAVDWQFMINTGQRAGAWSTLPVPSNWELHGFGT